jgi:hypothetical protein
LQAYRHLLLAEQNNRIPASDSEGGESASFNGLEGVLHLVESSLGGEDGNEVLVALVGFAHDI